MITQEQEREIEAIVRIYCIQDDTYLIHEIAMAILSKFPVLSYPNALHVIGTLSDVGLKLEKIRDYYIND